ncbi:unnamed protein product [Schistocephalus solidus]|uniref:Endo/exonuclease/phosphatase domain-containing protein n=1 Tax=Schistocephalus solidus TaxID=70667 RepID=A0A183SN85_SCHSO|nr:unnamed protein product [Schistocephalus solidus]
MAAQRRGNKFGYLQQPSDPSSIVLPLEKPVPNDHAVDPEKGGSSLTVNTSRANRKRTFMYTNAQSMLSKLDELKIHVCDLSSHIISLTETWLSQHVDDREVTMAGYQLFRTDRKERQGGGVLIYVKSKLTVLDKTDELASTSEAIWLSIKVSGSSSLDVLKADAFLLEELEKIATQLDILIMGDFNAPHID